MGILAGLLVWVGIGAQAGGLPISGQIVNGLRYLPVSSEAGPLHFTVYRGDYIKFELPPNTGSVLLTIPDLGIRQPLPSDMTPAPYFKMRQTGRFAFTLGDRIGTIAVVDFRPANYRELTASQAASFMRQSKPFVLDVRTPGEFKRSHLADAVLIPVQELQRRIAELSAYRDRDILIYCATGNRSTVASKIMLDQGFKHIANLRYGIVDWQRRSYPVVR